jgi:hypothetical protein
MTIMIGTKIEESVKIWSWLRSRFLRAQHGTSKYVVFVTGGVSLF